MSTEWLLPVCCRNSGVNIKFLPLEPGHLAHCIYLWQHIINYGHRKLHFCLRRIFILLLK